MQRRDVLKQLSALAALGGIGLPAWSQGTSGFELGSPPQPTDVKGKVEVLEFFHYGCPHCRDFDPLLELVWVKKLPADVVFSPVPGDLGQPQISGLAKLHLTLEATGDLARLHSQISTPCSPTSCRCTPRRGPRNGRSKGHRCEEVRRCLSVVQRQCAAQAGRGNRPQPKVQGVPTLAVDGKYFTSGSIAGTHEAALSRSADQLIARARSEQGRK